VLIGLLAGLKDAELEIQSMRISLESKKKLFRGGRAVYTVHVINTCRMDSKAALQRRLKRLKASQMVAVDMAQEARKWGAKSWDRSEEINCDPRQHCPLHRWITADLARRETRPLLPQRSTSCRMLNFSIRGRG
jgi:hypothetical protein